MMASNFDNKKNICPVSGIFSRMDRGNMVTVPTSEELAALFDQGMLAGEMARRFMLNDQAGIKEVATRCVELHNAGTLDLLRLVENNALQGFNTHDFFIATHFFCEILPELEETPARMMACVEALVTHGGDDMAANLPNAAFLKWCKKDPRRSREVISAAHSGDDLASRHLTFALEAINAVSEARQIALTYVDARRLSALTALSRMEDDDQASHAETLATFKAILDTGADDILRANLLQATSTILLRNLDAPLPEAAHLVSRLVADAGEFTMHQAAHILWECRKALQPNIIDSLLQALTRLNPANKRTVKELDFGLQALLKLGHGEAAIAYVTKLFSRSDDSLELNEFDSFTRTLVSGAPEILSRVVVQWLLLGTPRLCDGIANAIRGGHGMVDGPPLNLRAEDLTISPLAQVFICRKAIGWFFMKPTTAASVIVSVLRVCEVETALEVQKLLVTTLLLNFHGVRNYLEGLAPHDAAKGRVDQALAENEASLAALQAIPPIKELQPSEHHRRIERLRRSDQMNDAHKQAHSQSALLSMVKHSVLLYGNRSLSFIKDGKDALRPVEMDLKRFGVSIEMPRMDLFDPVGLDYILRVLRTEKMVS